MGYIQNPYLKDLQNARMSQDQAKIDELEKLSQEFTRKAMEEMQNKQPEVKREVPVEEIEEEEPVDNWQPGKPSGNVNPPQPDPENIYDASVEIKKMLEDLSELFRVQAEQIRITQDTKANRKVLKGIYESNIQYNRFIRETILPSNINVKKVYHEWTEAHKRVKNDKV